MSCLFLLVCCCFFVVFLFFLLLLFLFIFFLGGGCFILLLLFFGLFVCLFLVSAIDALDLVCNTRNSEQTEYVHIRERGAANRV